MTTKSRPVGGTFLETKMILAGHSEPQVHWIGRQLFEDGGSIFERFDTREEAKAFANEPFNVDLTEVWASCAGSSLGTRFWRGMPEKKYDECGLCYFEAGEGGQELFSGDMDNTFLFRSEEPRSGDSFRVGDWIAE